MPRNITVYISDDLDERMKKVPEVNWSEVCRRGIEGYLEKRIDTMEQFYKTLETILAKIAKLEFEVRFVKKVVIGETKTDETVAPPS